MMQNFNLYLFLHCLEFFILFLIAKVFTIKIDKIKIEKEAKW